MVVCLFHRCGDFILFDWVLCIFRQLLSSFLVFNNSLHFVMFRLFSLKVCNLLIEFHESRVPWAWPLGQYTDSQCFSCLRVVGGRYRSRQTNEVAFAVFATPPFSCTFEMD